jgi:hypothetical protein
MEFLELVYVNALHNKTWRQIKVKNKRTAPLKFEQILHYEENVILACTTCSSPPWRYGLSQELYGFSKCLKSQVNGQPDQHKTFTVIGILDAKYLRAWDTSQFEGKGWWKGQEGSNALSLPLPLRTSAAWPLMCVFVTVNKARRYLAASIIQETVILAGSGRLRLSLWLKRSAVCKQTHRLILLFNTTFQSIHICLLSIH